MRMFLHVLTGNGPVIDTHGDEFCNIHAAVAEARQTARDLMSERLLAGLPLNLESFIQVVNDQNIIEATVSFADAAFGLSSIHNAS